MTGRRAQVYAVLRLVAGGVLGWAVAAAVLAPDTTLIADVVALVVIALTFWRPLAGLVAVVVVAPAGLLIGVPPVHAAELMVWAFVSAWLLDVRRPLAGVALPSRAIVPALLYAACAFASWLGLTLSGAAGVEVGALPRFLARSLAPGHLLFTASEPETRTWLQTAAGLALFVAAMLAAGRDARAHRAIAYALVASAVALALATPVEIARQWSEHGYGAWFLLRYVRGERFALHLADLNAAGSWYGMAVLVAVALAIVDVRRRAVFVAAAAVILPALALAGSRAALVGGLIAGALVIAVVRSRVSLRATPQAAVVLVLVAVAGGGAAIAVARQAPEQGTAAHSMRLRSHFLVTSARMTASAPVFGVGIGHYHQRSNEFMPAELRAVYSHENAHNYFAQQFAELGVVGGVLFVWLVVAGLAQGWRALRMREPAPALLALFAGAAAYLVTCVTGHPLLVPETALPFWAVFGAIAASAPIAASGAASPVASGFSRKGMKGMSIAAALVVLVLAVGVALHARDYLRPIAPPPERGFYALETSEDGRPFVWMTRHGVWHVGPQPGFLRIPLRAPEEPRRPRPFVVEVEIGGRRVGAYEVPAGRWTEVTIPVREHSSRPFRRVDLWANQVWTRKGDLGWRSDDEPRSVMVGEARWEPAGAR